MDAKTKRYRLALKYFEKLISSTWFVIKHGEFLQHAKIAACALRDYERKYQTPRFTIPNGLDAVEIEKMLVDAARQHIHGNAIDGYTVDAPGGWIPASERLPRGCTPVLAYSDCGLHIAKHLDGGWEWPNKICDCAVTHWMPLPTPPFDSLNPPDWVQTC